MDNLLMPMRNIAYESTVPIISFFYVWLAINIFAK